MTRKPLFWIGAALAAAASAFAAPGNAHHAFAAEFDSSKPVVLDGTVTTVKFVNPHSWIYVDVKDKDGTTTNWGFEFGTPSSLRTAGIDRNAVAYGAHVRIAGYRAKNGGPYGHAVTVVLPDGRKVTTGNAPDVPNAQLIR